jgi:DUF4097 and DUF4098 domain-containing protein YvlB
MRRALAMAALSAATLFTAAVIAAPAHADDWSKTYPISNRADLHLSTDDGNVFIVGADQRQIDVKVTTVGYKISSSEVRIEESQNGDHVTLSVKLPHFNWSFWGARNRSVRIDLRVPRDLDLDVRTGDGDVNAQPVSGHLHIDTGDGNITANGLKGDINLHTGDGRIDASGLDGHLRADTGDGHVTVGGRFDSLTLQTGDGSIEAQASAGSRITDSWSINTGDGHVNLRIPSDFNADLNAHTGDGSITVDFPVTVSGSLSHSSVRGKLNAGGGELKISSGDGSIHLSKL